MQAVGIKTALACIVFGFSSLGPGGHFLADEGVSLRRDAGGHFATEFPDWESTIQIYSKKVKSIKPLPIANQLIWVCKIMYKICHDQVAQLDRAVLQLRVWSRVRIPAW